MKRNILVIIMVFGVLSAIAQTALPNFGFENWTTHNGREVPVSWLVRDTTASKTTDKCSGNYAIKIQTVIAQPDTAFGELTSLPPDSSEGLNAAFPVSARHTTLNGYYKYTPQNGDSAQILIFMFKHGYVNQASYNLLGGGWKSMGANTNTYAPFTINITYFDSLGTLIPDSIGLNFATFKGIDFTTGGKLNPKGNSILLLDNLSLDGFITGINNNPEMIKDVNIYPNPSSDILNIDMKLNDNHYNINMYDLTGKSVKSIADKNMSGNNSISVNINDIPQGDYILMISTDDGYFSKKVSIVR